MSKPTHLKPMAMALGTVFATSLAGMQTANADQNPFSMTQLSSGYMVADAHEGKCGEGKCGAGLKDKAKSMKEGKCGEGMKDKAKSMKEGKCGEGKCGAGMADKAKSMKEGKCGEGKCGAGMKDMAE